MASLNLSTVTPSDSSPASLLGSRSGPQLVLRIGAREVAVLIAMAGALVGAYELRDWNRRRMLAAEERKKARAKEWVKMVRRAPPQHATAG